MSGIVVLCRLCVSSRQEYKSLFDENGQATYIYEVTLRYFDPTLLSADQGSTVICSECWQHITDFYGFQESIIEAQSNLQDNQLVFQIKVEDEKIFEPQTDILYSQDLQTLQDDSDRQDFDNIKDYTSFTSDDDDKPLVYQKAKQKRLKAHEKRENDTVVSNSHTRPRSGSKPRSSAKMSKSRKNTKTPLLVTPRDGDQKLEGSVFKKEPTIIDNSSKDRKSIRDRTKEFDAYIAKWKQELECASCSRIVSNFEQLRDHYNAVHPNETCYTTCCDKKFCKRVYLFEHLQLHLNPEIYKCDICGKCHASSRNLVKHTRERHTEEGKRRPFGCDICRKKFAHRFTLRRHLKIHEKERDHICDECGKGFVSDRRRTIHERVVHGVLHGIVKYPYDQRRTQPTLNADLKRH